MWGIPYHLYHPCNSVSCYCLLWSCVPTHPTLVLQQIHLIFLELVINSEKSLPWCCQKRWGLVTIIFVQFGSNKSTLTTFGVLCCTKIDGDIIATEQRIAILSINILKFSNVKDFFLLLFFWQIEQTNYVNKINIASVGGSRLTLLGKKFTYIGEPNILKCADNSTLTLPLHYTTGM